MDEALDIRSLAAEENVYDVVYAWLRFPCRILLFAQNEGQPLSGISCRDFLTSSLRLLDKMSADHGKDYQAMLVQQAKGETAKIKLFPQDPTKDEEDVKRLIAGFPQDSNL